MGNSFPKKTALTLLTFVALVLLPQLWPTMLTNFKSVDAAKINSVLDFPVHKIEDVEDSGAASPIATDGGDDGRHLKHLVNGVHKRLLDPAHELDPFYRALQRGEGVNILHYGDSPTTADLITADARALFQQSYGDGGLGFVLVAKPWAWYNRRGVEMTSAHWQIDIGNMASVKDGRYGLGAVSFRGRAGSSATWKLKDHSHTSMEVAYLLEAGDGGEFTMEADGKMLGTASTVASADASTATPAANQPGFARFDIPEGSGEFTLRVTRGSVRLFGVDFRKAGPGVVYTSLGVNGANVTLLSHSLDEVHWAAELQHYKPDLVIINYGTNESGFSNFVDTTWGGELRKVIGRVRAALPGTSILLMSPMDRGEKDAAGEISTLPALPRLVSMEQRIAVQEHLAFFNTFEAMGGPGTMARWYSSEPRLVGADYIHPMPAGARIVGELLFSAFHDGFEQYKMQDTKLPVAKVSQSGPANR